MALLRHAIVHRDGVFLFDNGVGFGNAEIDSTFLPTVTSIGDGLAEHGVSLGDVTGVANCHLHFDHSGQNGRVPPGVPIFVQRAEWAMVHELDYTVAPGYPRSVERLRSLDPVRVHFAHDPAVWQR